MKPKMPSLPNSSSQQFDFSRKVQLLSKWLDFLGLTKVLLRHDLSIGFGSTGFGIWPIQGFYSNNKPVAYAMASNGKPIMACLSRPPSSFGQSPVTPIDNELVELLVEAIDGKTWVSFPTLSVPLYEIWSGYVLDVEDPKWEEIAVQLDLADDIGE